ncbi:MAG: hypothetical protein WKF84_02015 [Pyrinomonadaceae bacterium]
MLWQRKACKLFFYEFGALLKEIQESYKAGAEASELNLLAPVYETGALALDGAGAVRPTEWVRDTVTQIIGSRYNQEKLTSFTTNFFEFATCAFGRHS